MSLKRSLPVLGMIFFFILMLAFPQTVFSGASEGLLLWFHTVLPTLLPFLIITNLLLHTSAINWILRIISPILRRVFGVSFYGSFAVLIGFLCGYPMGSKITADLIKTNKITSEEGRYLLSFCNNTSPMFIISYVIWQNLKMSNETIPFFFILIISPVLCSFLFRRYYHVALSSEQSGFCDKPWKLTGKKKENGSLLDSCIMNGFETITKVGGYIMLFSILLHFAGQLPVPQKHMANVLFSSLEITSGIPMVCASSSSLSARVISVLGLTSFGGWCSVAQTRSMIQGTDLPIIPYILEKLITALVTSLLTYCYLLCKLL